MSERRRRRRRYTPGTTAAPERPVETLTFEDHVTLARYRADASRERTRGLSAKRMAAVGAELDRIEEWARENGIPAAELNRFRPSLARDPESQKLASELRFGFALEVGMGEPRRLLPRLNRRRLTEARRVGGVAPEVGSPPLRDPRARPESLEEQLAASLAQLRAAGRLT